MSQRSGPEQGLHLPRILCLHGGGTNGRIFRTQCRVLYMQLQSSFRLIFADAPFPSRPGPDVETVYADWGPFRSWLTNLGQLDVCPSEIEKIDASLAEAVREDDQNGATGAVVGVLGFSQGAKVAASLMWRQQYQESLGATSASASNYRFAVLMAGRGPLLSMSGEVGLEPRLLRLPTIHVHGLKDPGIEAHRALLSNHCEKSTTRLVEWDGNHRIPIKTQDVAAVVDQLMRVAVETNVLTC